MNVKRAVNMFNIKSVKHTHKKSCSEMNLKLFRPQNAVNIEIVNDMLSKYNRCMSLVCNVMIL